MTKKKEKPSLYRATDISIDKGLKIQMFCLIAAVAVNATGFFSHIVFILHVKLIFHQNFPVALTTTSTINRNVFFPYAKLQKKGQNCPK